MGSIKGLAKDTAIYGLSSIVGKFLNWLLVPLYTHTFLPEQYGVVSYVYAFVAIAMAVLTYGMETGFFRFTNHDRWKDPMQVYSTALISLATTSSAFIVLAFLFKDNVTDWLRCSGHASWAMIMMVCIAVDAFTALPFSYLRYRKRPIRFVTIKIINIAVNIGLNLFFILLCPWLMQRAPATVEWFYRPDFGIGYIFLSNLLASVVTLLLLLPELTGFTWRFSGKLWREMINYSFPLLLMGLLGIMNQTVSTLLFPYLYNGTGEMADEQLGIYNANYKLAVVMVMFIQAYRFAFEPFIFEKDKRKDKSDLTDKEKLRTIAVATQYFIILTLFIFLGVMYYLDIVKILIAPKYYAGLPVVPVLMIAELFFGVHFCLTTWYKLTDNTKWGTWLTLAGFIVTIALNVLLVPGHGYWGCAWGAFFCYLVMMVINYLVGRRYVDIPYKVGRIGMYALLTAILYVVGLYVAVTPWAPVNYVLRAVLLLVFVAVVLRAENVNLSEVKNLALSKVKR